MIWFLSVLCYIIYRYLDYLGTWLGNLNNKHPFKWNIKDRNQGSFSLALILSVVMSYQIVKRSKCLTDMWVNISSRRRWTLIALRLPYMPICCSILIKLITILYQSIASNRGLFCKVWRLKNKQNINILIFVWQKLVSIASRFGSPSNVC